MKPSGIRRISHAWAWCAIAVAGALAAAAALPAHTAEAQVAAKVAVARPGTPSPTGPMPLVQVDDELVGALHKAQEHVDAGRHDEAIEILQLLIKRPDSGFHVGKDGKHFVSLRLKAHEVIGNMGAKGLRLYRTLYDPQAERLFEEAMASEKPAAQLRKLAEEYLHTTSGPRALAMLGAIYFDEGRFLQAATSWRQLLSVTEEGEGRAMLLAKIAAAHHLGGEGAKARDAAGELASKYPKAAGELGGLKRDLAEFVKTITRMPAAAAPQDDVRRPDDCNVVLAPRWQYPSASTPLGDDVTNQLMAGAKMYFGSTANMAAMYGSSGYKRTIALKDGHLRLSSVAGGNKMEASLPAMVRPVIVDDEVICRAEDKVRSYDLLTGQVKWESTSLPMARTVSMPGMGGYYGGYVTYVGDSGRYGLSVGGGKVFTVYNFLASSQMQYHWMMARNPNLKDQMADQSVLAALSIQAEGLLKWRLGDGVGPVDVLKFGKFLCPPAYHAGRLYAVSLYLQRYHLTCLDAETGGMYWTMPIAQSPAMIQQYGYNPGGDHAISIGSPPAVADGRVFVATNSGVVAAFEAESGQPLWAYQYDSRANRGTNPAAMGYYNPYQQMVYPPANPVIVVRGRVIALPADADQVFALDAGTGEPAWQVSRHNQQDLSAIDNGRILISGKGLYILDTADGRELFGGQEDRGVAGRPLVTQNVVLACGASRLLSVDLEAYGVSSKGLTTPYGILGNLDGAHGKLVAVNLLGMCSYFNYEVARDELTDRLEKAKPADKAELVLKRAQLAFDDRRFEEAFKDLEECRKLAEAAAAPVPTQLAGMLYRTYVAMGNHAPRREDMRGFFLKAQGLAESRQEKAHTLLRLAKYHEKAAEYPAAAELAQELGEEFGDEELVDVAIGPSADDSVRFGPQARTVRGERLAKDYVQGLIEKYGRVCYAKFDEMAKEELGKAKAGGEMAAILAVEKRWPNSEHADDSLFAAAEAYYVKAGVQKDKADDYLAEARRHLYRVARMSDSPLRASASVGLATIYARGGWVTSARNECNWLRDLPQETTISFGDVKGSLADVLRTIEGGTTGGGFQKLALLSEIRPPLSALWKIEGADVFILRDQEHQPVRIGEKVVVIKGDEAYLMDTGAENAKQAVEGWKGLAGIDKRTLEQYPYFPAGMRTVGAVSPDRKTLVVADRSTVRGLDLASAKVVWQRRMDEVGIKSFFCMSVGQGVLVVAGADGAVSCVSLKDGQQVWRNQLVGAAKTPFASPWIAGDLVAIPHNNRRTVTCFSLAKEGRVVGKWEAKQSAQCELTPDGLLVLVVDGELTVRDTAQMDKPMWTARYDMNRQPCILAVSGEMVVVSPDRTGGPLDVLSVPGGGRKVATLKLEDVGGMQLVPVDAQFDGESVYVACSSAQEVGQRKAFCGRLSNCRGVTVQKFEIAGEKRVWSQTIEGPTQYYPNFLPLTIGKEHVVVTARQYNVGMSHYVYILDSKTGKEVQKIDLMSKQGADPQVEQRRRQVLCQPVMTTGRLAVENSEGVTVYGEK
jgi:outer membrane protein assembly factor BamB